MISGMTMGSRENRNAAAAALARAMQRRMKAAAEERRAAAAAEVENEEILRKAAIPQRVACLEEAAALTAGDRNRTYGEPVANMDHIARIFNAWTGRDLTAREIAQVHMATKMARSQTSPDHRDSYVDAMAYRGIEYECALSALKIDKG